MGSALQECLLQLYYVLQLWFLFWFLLASVWFLLQGPAANLSAGSSEHADFAETLDSISSGCLPRQPCIVCVD